MIDQELLAVLQDIYGLDGSVVFNDLVVLCPHPDHDDTEPSCYVLLQDRIDRRGETIKAGSWHCFSCGAKGDLIKLGCYALNLKRKEVRDLLEPDNPEAGKAALIKRLVTLQKPVDTDLSREKWEEAWRERPWLPQGHRKRDSYEDGPLTYLFNRGFSPRTVRKWGVRYVTRTEVRTKRGTVTLRNTVAIPICDRYGRVVCWCYRATDKSESWQMRYFYTFEAPRSYVFIGEHVSPSGSVVVGEGALDAMWIYQSGYPALGLGGTGLDVGRAQRLAENYSEVVLFMDRDKAGHIATWQIGSVLSEIVPTKVARYPKNASAKDPQELTEEEVRGAVERAIPWPAWAARLQSHNVTV